MIPVYERFFGFYKQSNWVNKIIFGVELTVERQDSWASFDRETYCNLSEVIKFPDKFLVFRFNPHGTCNR